ncbi:TPA: hypothetical protein OZ096_005135 [Escherichia coli]|uniref:hypothetical protein n=1 Tax=Escherichia coli TaxID=562 RepID=UPI0018B020D6|nr:hypothetical protein [Escherichia coli]EEW2750432.1 hypothetical protein [Escherichia coli]EEY6224976.1 hypothetical protein [Escherichia coli]EIK2010256.1 hypothetical protein [Escherichia coli]EKY6771999.1 hypothetical protein [Escherichia coli]ELI2306551.1 hypothetical protein [Escherichia coli]
MYRENKKFSKGLSLIEASMVLALSAVVVSGVLYYFNMASNNRKLQENVKSIQAVVSTIRALYANQPPGTPIDLDAVIKSGNFTKGKTVGAKDAIILPTGDTIRIYDGSRFPALGGKAYSLELRTKSSDVCSYIGGINFGTSHFGTEILSFGENASNDLKKLKRLTPSEVVNTCAQKAKAKTDIKTKIYFKY